MGRGDVFIKIFVCDAVMGSGKTQAAITMMNRETDRHFVFVTQFLDECTRIEQACPERKFRQPINKGQGKLGSFNDLLRGRHNIASTHALFYQYTNETLGLIREGHYTLILDEVLDIVEPVKLSLSDVDLLLKSKTIAIEPGTNRVVWMLGDYKGFFSKIRTQVESSCVTYEDNRLMMWKMPLEMFAAFDEVIILTYMFKAQYQAYYYEMQGVPVNYLSVRHIAGLEYEFVPGFTQEKIVLPTIHLCNSAGMNAIGDKYNALSATWQKNLDGSHTDDLAELKRNLANYFTNKCPVDAKYRMWSCYTDGKSKLRGNGYTKRYLAFNTRATNNWRECSHLAYAVNVFADVDIQIYFENRGFTVDSERLATSVMVQWLWRSRLRDGKEIWLYLPSSRMRKLLIEWAKEVTGSTDCIALWE